MSRLSSTFFAAGTFSVLLVFASAGFAQSDDQADDAGSAVIHFAAVGGIRDWRAGEDDALYIEGRNGMWYRATFLNRCPDIRFEEALAFVTDATGDLTSFSSVIAGDRRCFFDTLERTTDPDERPDIEDAQAP